MRSKTEVLIHRDASELSERGARVVAAAVGEALAQRDRCALALAGGSTPAALYRELSKLAVDWTRVDILFGDERAVPPDHEDSNYRMARTTLLDPARVPGANVHRAPADAADREQAARDYEQTIRRVVPAAADASNSHRGTPRFDVIMLGVGTDGHTASLFPRSRALAERTVLVLPVYSESLQSWRLTFTLPLINAARRIVFVVSGSAKAQVMSQLLELDERCLLPAALVAPADGAVTFLVDRAALGMP